VSSFCNDVVGDVCGIISGTASASIVVLMLTGRSGPMTLLEVLMAALVSGLTVGGKAVGKSLAMRNSTQIVHMAAMVVHYVKRTPEMLLHLFRRKK
jgi:CBS domain containing-hemolysin-like protein